jgi:Domain of unknown function (DUF4158)
VGNKHGSTRLGFAVLLKCFQSEGRFSCHPHEVPSRVVEYLAQQVGVAPAAWAQYDWHGRSIEYHRAQIRLHVGFREATVADGQTLITWLCEHVLVMTRRPEHLKEVVYQRCRELCIEPLTPERIDRLIGSAVHTFDTRMGEQVLQRLSTTTQQHLDALLAPVDAPAASPDSPPESDQAILHGLRADPGRATLKNLFREIAKLERARALELPADLFAGLSPQVLRAYHQRVAVEEPYELRRHPPPLRMSLLAAFSYLRGRELTDTLVELLIELIHRIGARAERRVEQELLEDLKRVSGKTGLLFRLPEATLTHPVVFPVVSEQTLHELVKEWHATDPRYRHRAQTVMQRSYRSHYRQMLPRLLETLEFRSNNAMHQPLIRALALLKRYLQSCLRTYPVKEEVPLEGVVRDAWREAVLDTDAQGRTRIHRITYEMCVLYVLRDQLRCKELWVVGADRYRNHDDDVPSDFAVQRPVYYAALKLPAQAEDFLRQMQQAMRDELTALDRTLPHNADVEILPKGKGWIKLSPLDPQPEPTNLLALKTEMTT